MLVKLRASVELLNSLAKNVEARRSRGRWAPLPRGVERSQLQSLSSARQRKVLSVQLYT